MCPSPSLFSSGAYVFPVPQQVTHDDSASKLASQMQQLPQVQQVPQVQQMQHQGLNQQPLPQNRPLLASPQRLRSPPLMNMRMSPTPLKPIPTGPHIPITSSVPTAATSDWLPDSKHPLGGSCHSRSSSSASSSTMSLSKSHKPVNNSISSMASTTSDLTIYENVVFHGQPMAPAMINDEYLMSSGSSTGSGLSQPKNVLNLLLSLDSSEPTRSTGLPKASSATEARFNIGHLGRFHTGDTSFMGAELAPSTSATEPTAPVKVNHLKKQATLPINFPYATETPTAKTFGNLHLTIPLAGPSGSFFKSPMSLKGWSPSSTGPSPTTPLDEAALINLAPSQIKYCNLDQLRTLMEGENIYPAMSHLGKVLMIDIRPFSDFIQLHMIGSINICLPSTLLRRNNFDLNRCINSLPTGEKTMLQAFLNFKDESIKDQATYKYPYSTNGLPPIVLMDNHSALPNLLFFIKKWINNDLWDSSAQIFILSEDIKDLPHTLVETGKSTVLTMTSPISSNTVSSFPLSTPIAPSCITPSRLGVTGLDISLSPSIAEENSLVSQFTLPSPRRVFKLRHNEELLDTSMAVVDNPFESNYANALSSELKHKERLPVWLRKSLEDPSSISNDFHRLERIEQDRLNVAFTGDTTDLKNDVPKISSGIEFGHKNRYKDIFLYEHSRVKLDDGHGISDYINASYINPPTKVTADLLGSSSSGIDSHLKYIATQGPLNETVGDFWRCVLNEKCRIIISLTDEIENGVPKCSPFWQSGTYESHGSSINVRVMEYEKYHDTLVFRRFKITKDSEEVDVLQAHLTSWPDMLTCDTNDDLIKLITLKYYLVDMCKPSPKDYPVIIHCSAGCGRTGTLCAIDTVVNLITLKGDADFEYDPVFEIVNNFRKQRVSMVQTLRQYSLVYDVLLTYLRDGLEPRSEWLELLALPIVQKFADILAQ